MDNIVDFYIDSVDNDKNGVSMEVMKCVDYFICDFYMWRLSMLEICLFFISMSLYRNANHK